MNNTLLRMSWNHHCIQMMWCISFESLIETGLYLGEAHFKYWMLIVCTCISCSDSLKNVSVRVYITEICLWHVEDVIVVQLRLIQHGVTSNCYHWLIFLKYAYFPHWELNPFVQTRTVPEVLMCQPLLKKNINIIKSSVTSPMFVSLSSDHVTNDMNGSEG